MESSQDSKSSLENNRGSYIKDQKRYILKQLTSAEDIDTRTDDEIKEMFDKLDLVIEEEKFNEFNSETKKSTETFEGLEEHDELKEFEFMSFDQFIKMFEKNETPKDDDKNKY
ncbi:unnamed protein product [Brachionus calyciflorus]|uniref:Uncharacterized protein n=1 Tax=Brachionus calyciflorus TaxID=104777 RepID=A0A814DZT9_9BILA|nr:unnamed protein product [Brachionus calyciflorus]